MSFPGHRFGSAQLDDTFLLVGGLDDGGLGPEQVSGGIVQFDPLHYQWVDLVPVLDPPRWGPAVVALPEGFADC